MPAGAEQRLLRFAAEREPPADDVDVQALLDRALLVEVQGGIYLPAEVETRLRV